MFRLKSHFLVHPRVYFFVYNLSWINYYYYYYSNPIHVVVRRNQTKNFDDLLTQLSDGSESVLHVKKIANSMFTQTEISEGGGRETHYSVSPMFRIVR